MDTEERPARVRLRQTQNPEDVPRVTDETAESVREGFRDFLSRYSENVPSTPTASGEQSEGDRNLVYIEQIRNMRLFGVTTVYVDFSHMLDHNEILARAVSEQYYRFLPYLRRAVQDLVKEHDPSYLYVNTHSAATPSSGLTTREFQLAFYNLPLVSGIRDLKTEKVGKLVSISGTVTRTSEVRPELLYGAFKCTNCLNLQRDVEQQFKYTEPVICRNPQCNNRKSWELNIEQSKFSDWQKVRIQENSNEIPTGSMPRSLDVILRAEIVERAKAGDKCVFTGTFIVVPDVSQLGVPGVNAQLQREAGGFGQAGDGINRGVSGLKALGVKDLTYKTAFLACMVQGAESRAGSTDVRGDDSLDHDDRDSFLASLTEQEVDELTAMVNGENIYSRLVQSIAPTVYGHEIVKKGLLLQLMGGVHKQTTEGIHLRGDINICIVGDPSTSKSQFLKYVCGFLPRGVYTSGKASSAAGLTAAVVKDEETGEFTIEAGALMLADNGICAIDEFDKMDLSDQVAIHEAMEQQTISIAKAGIQATLNARTSILAAANPVGGRYNRKMTLRANVAMSAPIMSRFDLFFVVLDECNETTDINIAKHIVNVHRFQDTAIDPEFTTEALQRYIRYARTFNPKLTPEASDLLVEKYRILRSDDAQGAGKNSYRITVRQLESMIRLSEAIARANCRNEITPAFVREAYSLLRQSIIHVEKDDIDFDDEEEPDGARVHAPRPSTTVGGESMDVDDAADVAALDAAEAEFTSPAPPGSSSMRQASTAPSTRRRKIKVSYEKYMTIMNLVVHHVSEVEREARQGVGREELVQWYLEQVEGQIQSVEELERETELVKKVLAKLVKDRYLIELRGESLQDSSDPSAAASVGAVGASSSSAPTPSEPVYMVHPEIDHMDLASSSLAV